MSFAVITNRYTAGPAEVLAGALRDYGRAVVLGEPTWGRAGRETMVLSPYGGAIKLTSARAYTPKGDMIEGEGVEPNVEVMVTLEEERALADRLAAALGGAPPAPGGDPAGPPEDGEFVDAQLRRAVAALTGEPVDEADDAVAQEEGE